jgi:hypothetical protein
LRNQRDKKNPQPKRSKVAGFFFVAGVKTMTQYEFYEHQKNFCLLMVRTPNIDQRLRTFYTNAAKGFEIKQHKLTVSEAAK